MRRPGLQVIPSPFSPWKGAPLRVMAVSEKPLDGTISLTGPDGSVVAKSSDRHGGPPYFWFAEVNEPAAGKWHASLALDRPAADCSTITHDINVSATRPAPVAIPAGKFWQVKGSWDHANETLFSAWIAKLFDAPADQDLNWKAWNDVLRDKSRNYLANYLGRNEDEGKSGLKPDCADFVYFLRAYFAYKMGLPFGYSNCSRGAGGARAEMLPVVRHGASERDASAASASEQDTTSLPPRRRRRTMRRVQPVWPQQADALAAPAGAPPARSSGHRRSRRPISANICATSATSCIPARCACPPMTRTPISTWCR